MSDVIVFSLRLALWCLVSLLTLTPTSSLHQLTRGLWGLPISILRAQGSRIQATSVFMQVLRT